MIGRRRRGRRALSALTLVLAVGAILVPTATASTTGTPASGSVALTFDDGPDPRWTPIILDILDDFGVKATFFVVGRKVDQYPDLAREIVARGHSIQNHTYSHAWLTNHSTASVRDQIERTNTAITRATGTTPTCIRPPYGATNSRVRSVFAEFGLGQVMWTVDTRDSLGASSTQVYANALRYTKPNSIVLGHDTNGWKWEYALPRLLKEWTGRGYTFDTLCNAISDDEDVDRLAGSDRFASAALVAERFWPSPTNTVVIAQGHGFADALVGSNLHRHGAPLLLVTSTTIPPATRTALTRLSPTTIYLLGGTSVISQPVATELGGWAPVIRLAGRDRYATAVAITREAFPSGVDTVLIASGTDFPDAVTGGAAAARADAALLITDPDSLPGVIRDEIGRLDPRTIFVLGGPAAVSEAVLTELRGLADTVKRLSGSNRYGTGVAISRQFFTRADVVLAATGESFPDALIGSFAAGGRAPVLLVPPTSVPTIVADEIERLGATAVFVLGGTGNVTPYVANALQDLVRP